MPDPEAPTVKVTVPLEHADCEIGGVIMFTGLLTVITADPLKSAGIDAQVPFVKVAIVYVVVAEGLTETVIVGAIPLKAVPFDNVPVIVPEPVTAKDSVVVDPVQMEDVPVTAPVGRGFTTCVKIDEVLVL